jgi:IstB-like ATP binding protein
VTGPAAPPVPAELETLMRRMRLPYLRNAAPEVLATARAQRWDPAEVLRVLLAEEVTGRDAATRRTRRKAAGFPAGKTFASWRPDESSISAATQNALATLEWISRAENLVIAGPSGTGKSHFAEAPRPRCHRQRPAGRLVHPRVPDRRDRPRQSRRINRPDRHPDLPQRPDRRRRHRHAARRAGSSRSVLPDH